VAVAAISLPHEHRSTSGKNIHYQGFASSEAIVGCYFGCVDPRDPDLDLPEGLISLHEHGERIAIGYGNDFACEMLEDRLRVNCCGKREEKN
jgi:hypothetical protein